MQHSIVSFSEALLLPELSLRTLGRCEVILDGRGMPALKRTSTTVEAEIRLEGVRYLLVLPLTEREAHRLERTISALSRLHHPALAPIRMLPDELHWHRPSGEPWSASLILQELRGESLWELFGEIEPDRLTEALRQLQAALEELNLTHNNLKSENLRWDGERLSVIRPWHARIGGDRNNDLARLQELMPSDMEEDMLSDCDAPYSANDPETRWRGHEFEGLTCVESATGYGYQNRAGEWQIEPQYFWAEDFHEGRAVVETEEGMGLIDRTGHYIIPPRYEILEYDYYESLIHARKAGAWGTFDITGALIAPFTAQEALKTNKQ